MQGNKGFLLNIPDELQTNYNSLSLIPEDTFWRINRATLILNDNRMINLRPIPARERECELVDCYCMKGENLLDYLRQIELLHLDNSSLLIENNTIKDSRMELLTIKEINQTRLQEKRKRIMFVNAFLGLFCLIYYTVYNRKRIDIVGYKSLTDILKKNV